MMFFSSNAFHFILVLACNAVTSAAGELPVELGFAGDYVILAKAGITAITSAITGDIGVSPIAESGNTGFGFTNDSSGTFSTSSLLLGTSKSYAANNAPPTPALLTTAVSNMEAAYTDAAGRGPAVGPRLDPGSPAGSLGGVGLFGGTGNPLTTGVYTFDSDVTIANDIFFSGTSTDVFIIQMSGSLVQTADTNMHLGSTQAENIFWQVAGNVMVGERAHLEGILLVKTDVSFLPDSSLHGHILAQTSCHLVKNNAITVD
jgi:hypothetical protein